MLSDTMRRFLIVALLIAGVSAAAAPVAPRRVAAERHGVIVLSSLNRALSFASPEEIGEPMPVPADLPLSAHDLALATREVRALSTLRPVAGALPSIARSFVAFRDDNTSRPPDTHGAAGPNHLITALNAAVVVQNRSGGVITAVSLDVFFGPVREGTRSFDPRVLYDHFDGRWIISAAAASKSASSAAMLAVSRTSDPTGIWDLYRYAADATGKTWFDFPMLGLNDRHITMSGNMYNLSDNKFNRAVIFIFDKASFAMPAVRFDFTSSGGSLTPVISYDSGVSTLYFVQRWNGNSNGRGFLRVYTGSLTQIVPLTFVSTSTPWSGKGAGEADFAPQSGSAEKIDAGDDRITSAIYRNGTIWAAHTIFLPAGSPARAAVQWLQITPAGVAVQRGTIEDEQNAFFYAFPSLAVNRRNDVLIGLTRFSRDTLPSAAFAFRASDAGAFTLEVFKHGEAPYVKTGATGNRWGDYSATVVDPVNEIDFWTIQEYAGTPDAGSDRWGTWWAQVTLPASSSRHRSVRH